MPEAAPLEPRPVLPPGTLARSPRLRLTVPAPLAWVRLQLAARELAAAPAALQVGGIPLPGRINRWTGPVPVICRIAPDLWMLQATGMEPTRLAAMTATACTGRAGAITDLSDALATLSLDGDDATALLARGCGLDLSLAAFPPDACTRTRLAQLAVLVRRTPIDGYELTVEAPAARWLYDWLVDAAAGLDHRE